MSCHVNNKIIPSRTIKIFVVNKNSHYLRRMETINFNSVHREVKW